MKRWWPWLFLVVGVFVGVAVAYQFRCPAEIVLGEQSADPFIEGFYFRERAEFGGFRWSGARARLFFYGIGNQEGTLWLRAAAPAGAATLYANGRRLGPTAIKGGQIQDYAFTLERGHLGWKGDLVATLEGATFTTPPDPRELGLQVISARFEPQPGWVFPAPAVVLGVEVVVLLLFAVARAWSGSGRLAWAISVLAVLLVGLGLARARLETAWLVRVAFWLGLGVCAGGWAVVWLMRRFHGLQAQALRLAGLFMLAALAVRLPLATTPGFVVDVQDYVVWSYKLTHYGLGSAYTVVAGLWGADYPPGLLYLFQGLGWLYQHLFAPDFLYPVTAGDPALRALTSNPALLAAPVHRTLLRMPAILADVVTGALVFAWAQRRLSLSWSLLVASMYWFNPAIVYNSALYGQTDAVHTLLVVLALALIETDRSGWGFLALALGGLTKPQALVFGPLLLVRVFQHQRWRGIVRAAAGGAVGFALLVLPMVAAGALPGLLAHFRGMIGHHAILSANAHNLWWFAMRGEAGIGDANVLFAGLSYRVVGLLLLALAYGLALVALFRCPACEGWPIAAYVGFAFFVLPTEIHENYGFAVLALLAISLTLNWRLVLLYVPISLTMTVNYALHDPNVYLLLDLSAPDAQLAGARWANAAVNVLIFVLWTGWLVWSTVTEKGSASGLSAQQGGRHSA